MADGGVSLGLPRDVAYKLASQTLIGSGMMQKETAMHSNKVIPVNTKAGVFGITDKCRVEGNNN